MAMTMRMTIDQKIDFLQSSFLQFDPETLFMVLQVHVAMHTFEAFSFFKKSWLTLFVIGE
jgi:hypothetical protein